MELKKKILFLFIGIIIIWGIIDVLMSKKEEESLYKNRVTTFGRVTDFNFNNNNTYVYYEFYTQGELFKGSRIAPKFIIGNFYKIYYDKTNPNNSTIIRRNSRTESEVLQENGIKWKGTVTNITPVSNDYADLKIAYTIYDINFNVRTRLHIDSLPCGSLERCLNSDIDMVVSKNYPKINDLYYKSHDRKATRNRKLIDKWSD